MKMKTGERPHNTRTIYSSDLPSRTKQSFKDECDINKIMKQYERTSLISHENSMHPQYGDFANVDDYHTSMNKVAKAHEEFENLSARVRKRMGHDPAVLIAFMDDPDNLAEAISLGLVQKPKGYKTPTTTAEVAPAQPKATAGEAEIPVPP